MVCGEKKKDQDGELSVLGNNKQSGRKMSGNKRVRKGLRARHIEGIEKRETSGASEKFSEFESYDSRYCGCHA